MAEKIVSSYGSWRSPITSDLITSETIGLGEIVQDSNDIYWLEMRPAEGGRYVIVRRMSNGQIKDVTSPQFNVRTRVHEFGGGAFTVKEGTMYFSNFNDQRLYRQNNTNQPQSITPAADLRYADGVIDQPRSRMICVREDHTTTGREPFNTIVDIDLSGSKDTRVLVSGNDFYSTPRLSPDGTRLAWLTWNHPNMPWIGTELWISEVKSDGSLVQTMLVAGGPHESIFQPEWSPDGILHFVSDRNDWWNLYQYRDRRVESLINMEAEFGQPQWMFGISTYAFVSDTQIVCTYTEKGFWRLALLNRLTHELKSIQLQYTDISYLHASQGCIVFRGGSPIEPMSIVQLDLKTQETQVLRSSNQVPIDDATRKYFSIPEPVEFPTENGLTAHGFFYRPQNPEYVAHPEERPPLLVKCHSGPTAAASSTLDLKVQYWTSRGFAILDVNYGGSTGYGREYSSRLEHQWGVVDLNDCVNGAKHLVMQNEVDSNRLAITGGSAGGYTTLCALTFRNIFKADASYYGISDLEALAKDTHKFESHYLDWLIGPYPECSHVYKERSPIHSTEKLSVPVIFFQGDEDMIVPPSQTELMVEALHVKGLPFGYFLFSGEQHGFLRAESIKRALDAELYFYAFLLLKTGLRF